MSKGYVTKSDDEARRKELFPSGCGSRFGVIMSHGCDSHQRGRCLCFCGARKLRPGTSKARKGVHQVSGPHTLPSEPKGS